MPDAQRLRQIEAAADPKRYRLLEEAVLHKSFLAKDAERIATGARRGSGTARTNHARRLVALGLLRRKENPVRFVATTTGKVVFNTLRHALNKAPPPREDDAVVMVGLLQMRGQAARDAATVAQDLVTALETELHRAAAALKAGRIRTDSAP